MSRGRDVVMCCECHTIISGLPDYCLEDDDKISYGTCSSCESRFEAELEWDEFLKNRGK